MKKINSKYITSNIKQIANDLPARNQVYCLSDNNHILKVYGNINNWDREVKSLSSMARSNCFEVPQILDFGTDKITYWVVMSQLHGIPFDKLVEQGKISDTSLFYKEIGKLHALFHLNNIVDYKGDWSKHDKSLTTESYLEYEKNNNKKYASLVLSKKCAEHSLFQKAYTKMIEYELYLDIPSKFCLCHNDFSERNILYDPSTEKVTGVIDFERAYPSDPESDLLKMYFRNINSINLGYYLDSYDSIAPLSENFKSKMIYLLMAFCFEICSWSKDMDANYYNQAIKILSEIM